MVPVVKPVVLPLLATDSPTDAGLTVALIVPMSSMYPLGSIVPARNCARAASPAHPRRRGRGYGVVVSYLFPRRRPRGPPAVAPAATRRRLGSGQQERLD